ncbi:MAG: PepSY domain-containing protein [Rhodocyclaceae bacterium]|nr:PepSY domain-containing protein [Rhodocyclaceae bacterium]
MKRSTTLASLLLGATLTAGGFMLAPSFAGENRPAAPGEGQWLSIPQVHDKLQAAGYRDIEKIEREHGGYEARATDRNGQRIKLYLNPRTGEVLDRGRGSKGDQAEGQRRHWDGAGSANCNERRCRDDLPQKASPPAPAAQ